MPYSTQKLGEDESKNSRILFSILTGRGAHILTIIICGHLLVEHYLDNIIGAKRKDKETNLKKSFSEKLKILYPDWLPAFIYKNAKLLNDARNYAAHNLGVIGYQPIFYTPTGDKKVITVQKKKSAEKIYFRELVNRILFDLVNYSFHSLSISPEPDLNIIFRTKK